jgi:hypothetical protein
MADETDIPIYLVSYFNVPFMNPHRFIVTIILQIALQSITSKSLAF